MHWVTPVVDVKCLAYGSPDEVDSLLGTPESVTPIDSYPDQMPGEWRTYVLRERCELTVRFYKGRAVVFTLSLDREGDRGVASPEEAVRYIGVDVSTLIPDGSAEAGHWWRGEADGIQFKRIGATKNSIHTALWQCAQAKLDGSPA